MFWSAHLKIDIAELEKVTEKEARLGIARKEQGTRNQESLL